jgi:hypothetical protein
MAEHTVRGSLLCKSVRYEVSTLFPGLGIATARVAAKLPVGSVDEHRCADRSFRWTQGKSWSGVSIFRSEKLRAADAATAMFPLPARPPASDCSAGTLDDVPLGKPAQATEQPGELAEINERRCRARINNHYNLDSN